jgi:uncharacterized protein (TIGR02145 family)
MLWAADTTGAYCYYDNDIANKADYGALYNWYAVDNAHGLAPAGWRVPSQTDIATLIAYAGGITVAGGALKEVGIGHWNSPNVGALDSYGFALRGEGNRQGGSGIFSNLKAASGMWTTTLNVLSAYYLYVSSAVISVTYANSLTKTFGQPVRMMRDI